MVMWPKFGNSSISMREVVIIMIWPVKFNNLGLVLGMALKFYTSVAEGLKLKIPNHRKSLITKTKSIWATLVEGKWKKLVGGEGGFFIPSFNTETASCSTETGRTLRATLFDCYQPSFWFYLRRCDTKHWSLGKIRNHKVAGTRLAGIFGF